MGVLFFIVLPLATILISIVLQKLLRSPILVAILVFAVYLILAFTVFTEDFLINAIIYTILSFITAVIVRLICCLLRRLNCNDTCNCGEEDVNNDDLSANIASLRNSMRALEDSIEALEVNIQNLTDILSNNNNNSCGCNNGCNRWRGR